MQHKPLFVFLLLLCCGAARAQMPLDSFFRIGAVWTEYDEENYGQGLYSGHGYRLQIRRDSAFNGNNYHLLEKSEVGGYSQYTSPQPNPGIQYFVRNVSYGTVAALRTSGKKVYAVNLDTANHDAHTPFGQEAMLYDFDLHTGDVVAWKPYHDTVRSIDSVLLSNGRYMRRYRFDDYGFEEWWSEGTGSFLGVLGAYENTYPAAASPHRFRRSLCYDNGSFSYHEQSVRRTKQPLDSSCYSEAVLRSLDAPAATAQPDDNTRFYPIPSRPAQQITIENERRMIRSITVVDAQGRKVLEYRNIDAHTFRMSLPAAPGLYEVAVTYDDQVVRGRTLVRD